VFLFRGVCRGVVTLDNYISLSREGHPTHSGRPLIQDIIFAVFLCSVVLRERSVVLFGCVVCLCLAGAVF